jgi:hypothetical protein
MSEDNKRKTRSELQAIQDDKRSHNYFQVRLDESLGDKLRDYMRQRDYNANQALKIIISRFFTGK